MEGAGCQVICGAPTVNQTTGYVKVVKCSNDTFCLSLFMIMPNDFVCCASELEFSRI